MIFSFAHLAFNFLTAFSVLSYTVIGTVDANISYSLISQLLPEIGEHAIHFVSMCSYWKIKEELHNFSFELIQTVCKKNTNFISKY